MGFNTELMPNAERDDESGKYTSTYPREAFVDAVRAADGFAGTQDVADAVGCSYELAYKRLRALADAGDVESQKVANARVWVVTEDTEGTQAAERAREPAVTPSADTVDRTDTLTVDSRRERAREILTELDRAGEGTDYDRRRDAVLQMYEHLQANPGDRLERQDFKELLAGEDVGYGGGFASLWSNWVKADEKRGRPENALAVLPGVELRGDDYVYQGGGDE